LDDPKKHSDSNFEALQTWIDQIMAGNIDLDDDDEDEPPKPASKTPAKPAPKKPSRKEL
jgi:hypothetical protein